MKVQKQDDSILESKQEQPEKLNATRILSAFLFVMLVWLVVWGTDTAINFVKGIFLH